MLTGLAYICTSLARSSFGLRFLNLKCGVIGPISALLVSVTLYSVEKNREKLAVTENIIGKVGLHETKSPI